MLKPIHMRTGEFGTFPYRIVEYDEVTQAVVQVDLTGYNITFNLYNQTQQTDGTFLETLYASGLSCSVLDADEGWVECNLPEELAIEDPAWVRIEFVMATTGVRRVCPRFCNQMMEFR